MADNSVGVQWYGLYGLGSLGKTWCVEAEEIG
jgi:hypothetical protein